MNSTEPSNNSPASQLPTAASRFQGRALTSVIVTLSFLVLAGSGLVLAISPPGRIANWTDWSILGLRKSEWGDLHIWFSVVFLAASAFHIFLNWRPLLGYFKDRISRQLGFRYEWVAGVAICAAVFLGTRKEVPPFSSLLAATEQVRGSWEKQIARPPIPHAELLTVQELAEKAGVELAVAMKRLSDKGIQGVSPEIRMAALAKENRLPAKQLYDIMLQTASGAPVAAASGSGKGKSQGQAVGHGAAGGGPGQKTLDQYCAEEGIDLQTAQARLTAKGYKVTPGLTLREMAIENGFQRPYELLDVIRAK